jgi:hypothetical protein
VLELVDRLRRRAAPIDQLGLDQLLEGVLEGRLVESRDRRQQVVAEHPAERRCEMRDVLDVREAIQARHERVVERFGNGQRRQRSGQAEAVAVQLERAGTEQRLGQFLGVQGHAIGPGDDVLEHFRRQFAAARDLFHQGGRLAVAQVRQRERRHVRKPGPRRGEAGPIGDHSHHQHALDAMDDQLEQLGRGGVDPVRVLEDDQDRPGRQSGELFQQGLERQGLLAFGRDVELGIALAGGNRQQRREQGRCPGDLAGALAEQRLQLVQLDLGRVALLQLRGPLQLVEHRMQGAVDIEW